MSADLAGFVRFSTPYVEGRGILYAAQGNEELYYKRFAVVLSRIRDEALSRDLEVRNAMSDRDRRCIGSLVLTCNLKTWGKSTAHLTHL